jgi:hypothetical protein
LRKHVWITNFPFLEQLYPFKSSFQRIWSCIFLTFTTSDMGWKPRQCQLQTLDWFRLYFNSLWAWKQENWVLRYHRICLTFSKR